ncbi:MAG: alpha/beta fold hydrolase BchO [Pseudomonadota bacterium]
MFFNQQPLEWEIDRQTWPHHECSRFVFAGRVRFHVQITGDGPVLLMLHGTGASAHSWRDLIPGLAEHFQIVVPDLPGHGFTSMPGAGRISLPAYAELLGLLMRELEAEVDLVVGHSAGAAIAAQMVLDQRINPKGVISFNGAFRPMGGQTAQLFSPLAKLLSLNPLVPRFFAGRASDPAMVERLIAGTGSVLDADGIALYQRLMRSGAHVDATLQMMANWDLTTFADEMKALTRPLLLVTADGDKAIPADEAHLIAGKVQDAEVLEMRGVGHVAHEEDPHGAGEIISSTWQKWQAS